MHEGALQGGVVHRMAGLEAFGEADWLIICPHEAHQPLWSGPPQDGQPGHPHEWTPSPKPHPRPSKKGGSPIAIGPNFTPNKLSPMLHLTKKKPSASSCM